MLDINLLRPDKGGDPELVRESERRRFADPSRVDLVLQRDQTWRDGAAEPSSAVSRVLMRRPDASARRQCATSWTI